jgi:HK97 family phage major capsid protein/HK97 family phage prohead protease
MPKFTHMKKPAAPDFYSAPMRRVMTIGTISAESRTVELAFSSNAEIERWPGIAEVLDHSPEACDLSRLNDRANLLFNHDADEVLGVVETARIDADGMGRAVVRFGKSECAEEAWQDVQDGILTKVSVGYRIREVKLTEEREALDVYTVTRWEPYEISLVTIPADPSVGVGRSQPQTNQQPEMKKYKSLFMDADKAVGGGAPAPSTPEINIEAERSAAIKGEQDRVRSILEAGDKYKLPEIAAKVVREGGSLLDFQAAALAEKDKRSAQVREASSPIGLNEREASSFSFVKLIRALAAEPTDKKAREDARFELEACEAAAGQVAHRNVKGTMIPVDVLTAGFGQRGTNTVSQKAATGYTGTGGNTVQTSLLAASFIDVLRNKTVIMNLGTELAGLVGNVDMPKQTTFGSGYWIGEDEDATKSDIDFGLVSLRPRTVANYGEITRRMLMQPSLSVEALLRNDLAKGLALTIDTAAFYGTGLNNQPVGIKSASGVLSKSFVAVQPTFAELVDMESLVAAQNTDVDSMAFVANPSFRGSAKTSLKFPSASTNGGTIWENGTVNGYRTEITNQIVSGDIFFGNFADFVIGLWGGLEITVDPYSNSTKGRLRIVCMQDVDFAVRRAQSFVYGKKP